MKDKGYFVVEKQGFFGNCYLRVTRRGIEWVNDAPMANHFPPNQAEFYRRWAASKSPFSIFRTRRC